MLAGGWVADRFGHHGLIVAICSLVLAAMAGVVALVTLPPPALLPLFAIGGLASGMVAPVARHDDPRHHPARRQRRVFGLVMVGFNVGGLVAPPLYGLTVDHASPAWVFGIVAMVSLATALTGLRQHGRQGRASRRPRMRLDEVLEHEA